MSRWSSTSKENKYDEACSTNTDSDKEPFQLGWSEHESASGWPCKACSTAATATEKVVKLRVGRVGQLLQQETWEIRRQKLDFAIQDGIDSEDAGSIEGVIAQHRSRRIDPIERLEA